MSFSFLKSLKFSHSLLLLKIFLNSEVYFSRSEVKKQESGWFTSPESIMMEPEVTTVKQVTPKKKKNKRVSTTKSVAISSRQMTTSNDDEEEEDELPTSTTAITIHKEIK